MAVEVIVEGIEGMMAHGLVLLVEAKAVHNYIVHGLDLY